MRWSLSFGEKGCWTPDDVQRRLGGPLLAQIGRSPWREIVQRTKNYPAKAPYLGQKQPRLADLRLGTDLALGSVAI